MAFVKRKKIRLEGYDYSSCGAYFITICVADRNRLLWQNAEADYDRKRAEAYSHEPPLLSGAGTIVKNEIQKSPNDEGKNSPPQTTSTSFF